VFERFTERARQVVMLAQDEARRLRHNYIGTEHLLLGLIREEEGIAARTLAAHGITLDAAREWVSRTIGEGDEALPGDLPFTPRMKKILELSLSEAIALNHNYIGTEHLLIALLHEGEGAALHTMRDLGAPPDEVWASVYRALGAKDIPARGPVGGPRLSRRRRSWLDRAAPVYFGGAAMFGVGLFVGWLIWA
jgi:ATP-dependent Clp protease ATP-binding subunit ClpC